MELLLRYEPEKAKMLWHQIHDRRRRDQRAGKGDFTESNIVYKFLVKRGLIPKLSDLTGEYIASVRHNLWHEPSKYPNEWGRGLVEPSGRSRRGTSMR